MNLNLREAQLCQSSPTNNQTNKQTNKQKNNSAKKTHFGSAIYHYIWVTRFQVLTIF